MAESFEGIPIHGSGSFVQKTCKALRLILPTQYWRYARALKYIKEGPVPPGADAIYETASGGCTAKRDWGGMGNSDVAAVIVHEGAHAIHGAREHSAWTVEYNFLLDIGERFRAAALYRKTQDQRTIDFYDQYYGGAANNPNRVPKTRKPAAPVVREVRREPEWLASTGNQASGRIIVGAARINIAGKFMKG